MTFHPKNFWVLGLGITIFGFWVWVLGLGIKFFGFGYIYPTQTQNPKIFGCKCLDNCDSFFNYNYYYNYFNNVMLSIPSYSFFLLLIPTNLCMKHPRKKYRILTKKILADKALKIQCRLV